MWICNSYGTLGRRLSKETKESLIKYIYSNQDAVEESEYRKDDEKLTLKGVKENVYGQGIDDIVVTIVTTGEGKKKTENRYFYQKNQLGSITAITDEKGKIVEEYRYDVFGKAYMRDGKSENWREFGESKVRNTRLFTGREYDGETGLYYYRARYYSAEMGRFISRDPVGTVDNVNLYSYVGNSPVMYVDAMGREKQMIIWKLEAFWNQFIDIANLNWEINYKQELLQQGNTILWVANILKEQNQSSYNNAIVYQALKMWATQDDSFSFNGTVEGNFYRTVWSWEYKCSTFVATTLENSVAYTNNSDYSYLNLWYNPVTANNWAYSNVHSFETVDPNRARAWDIIAFGSVWGNEAWHVGIYLTDKLYISAREWAWYDGPKFTTLRQYQPSDGIMIKDIQSGWAFTLKRYTP